MTAPLPRIVLCLQADGSIEAIADRPCRIFITGGALGRAHAELPTPRVGWPLVTAALDEVAQVEAAIRAFEGAPPCDQEHAV